MSTLKDFFTHVFDHKQSPVDGVAPIGFAPNEEFESKRTTKLGMVFIVIMVITGIWQGQSLFSAVSATITPPANLSSCFMRIVSESGEGIVIDYDSSSYNSTYSYQNVRNSALYNSQEYSNAPCVYTDLENKYGIAALYSSVEPLLLNRDAKYKEKYTLESKLSTLQYSSNGVRDSYNTSLFESIAQASSSVYASSALGGVLRTKEEEMQELRTNIKRLDDDIISVTSEIRGMILSKISDVRAVADEFNSLLKWLEFKRFIVSIILLVPLAIFTIRRYFRSKNERSEFAIIWAAVALISTILSTQLLVVFAYRILPHRLIQMIAEMFAAIFTQFAFLLVLLQWFALILVPLFFGFLVYKIQKRFYNKEAVMMRALKDGKCPQCTMKIKDAMVFCPSCSYALRKTCASCKHTSISYARFCEECGVSFQKKEI